MLLGNLLKSVSKDYQRIPVDGISFDSRKVKKRDIFFAIKGNKTSGIKFIDEAISRGALAIVSNKKEKYKNSQIPLVLVKDVRESLSEACSNYYKKKPSNIIAVTGTNGKSSIASLYFQILKKIKLNVASIGNKPTDGTHCILRQSNDCAAPLRMPLNNRLHGRYNLLLQVL